MTVVQPRRWLLALLAALPACHPNDFIVVKLETASGLPPIAQLTLQANDAASQSTATEPATPNLAGIAFPETYVIATAQGGPVNILVSGLDGSGNVIARGATAAVASGNVQAVVVTLTGTCASALDCDPAGVCTGSVTCSDAGACVPGSGTVAPNATNCGHDGGICESGNCILPRCGDGIAEPGKQCDLGPLDSNGGQCTLACQWATCGDGYVNQDPLPDGGYFQELCDWGSGADGGACTGPDGGCNSDTLPNHCRANCLPARCGDGVVDTGERCDLGPPGPDGGGGNGAGVGCNATCTLFGQVTTLTGSNGVESYQDGPLASALFNAPRGLTILGSTLYVADEFNDLLRAIDLDAGAVRTLAGKVGSDESLDGDAGTASFESPLDVTVFQTGLAVAEPTDVRVVDLDGTVTTLVGKGNDIITSDGPFADAGFVNLQAITRAGPDLYVTDRPLGVRELDIAAQEVVTLYPDGGAETATSTLSGLTSVDGGLLFVADSQNDDLQSVDPSGDVFEYIAGDPGGAGFVDGIGLAAKFSGPAGICTDGQSIYVADQLNGSVRQVVPATASVTTLAGNGQQATTPQDGTGRSASFDQPAACVWDPASGDVFVTDVGANTIRRIH